MCVWNIGGFTTTQHENHFILVISIITQAPVTKLTQGIYWSKYHITKCYTKDVNYYKFCKRKTISTLTESKVRLQNCCPNLNTKLFSVVDIDIAFNIWNYLLSERHHLVILLAFHSSWAFIYKLQQCIFGPPERKESYICYLFFLILISRPGLLLVWVGNHYWRGRKQNM